MTPGAALREIVAGRSLGRADMHAIFDEIMRGAEQLASAAEELQHTSEEVASRSHQQSEAASAMAAAIEEMTVSIDQVAHNAGKWLIELLKHERAYGLAGETFLEFF